MPFKYIVSHEGMLVLERWTGTVSHRELVDHEINQLQDTSIAPGAAVLAHCTEATFETPNAKVIEISETYGRADNKTNIAKYALIVNDDAWERAQLFAKQAEKYGVTIIAFCMMDTACTWLGIDKEDTAAMLEAILA